MKTYFASHPCMLHIHPDRVLHVFLVFIIYSDEWKLWSFIFCNFLGFFFFFGMCREEYEIHVQKISRKPKATLNQNCQNLFLLSVDSFPLQKKKTLFLFPSFWIGSVTFRFFWRPPPPSPSAFSGTQLHY